jgi:hypothetical protein
VTHPFHPLCGREFPLVDRRRVWGEDRLFFYEPEGVLRRLPAAWTSLCVTDAFVVAAEGRAPFRVEDLVAVARRLAEWTASSPVEPPRRRVRKPRKASVK